MAERIFALDIGTRTVVGLILEQDQDKYELIDYCIQEHKERSMLDGQIHDIVAVANVIKSVKEKLEEKHGQLSRVCVAAAGRALKTKRSTISKTINEHPLLEQEDILFMEFSAVQTALHDLAIEEESSSSDHYYCVGYSVLQYKLDNSIIGSLIDQQGDIAEVEIIATFLPKIVVESLISALTRANLEMDALTLEPIAAINVLIPPSMRRLNVALVDIGAGTSDIALTEAGTVTAYGMVPCAGDSITETISDHYLLDFPQAEIVKRKVTKETPVTITDILGFEQTIDYMNLADAISSQTKALVDTISNEIIQLNNRSPKAVMLVGGGSQTPEITKYLADKLQLPTNRVAIRGIDAIQALKKTESLPTGPTFVTPIGIAIAARQNPVHYISITVNGKTVRLFDMKQLSVGDGLLAAGITIEKLYGKPGIAYIVDFNGQEMTLPGSYGQNPILKLNNRITTINATIKHGDLITVEKGVDGEEPIISIQDLVGELPSVSVTYNDDIILVKPTVIVNNQPVRKDYIIQDHDVIQIVEVKTIKDFLGYIEQTHIIDSIGTYQITLNDQKVTLPYENRILQNGANVPLNNVIQEGDIISYQSFEEQSLPIILDYLEIEFYKSMTVTFNDEPLTLQKQVTDIFRGDKRLTEADIIKSGDSIHTISLESSPFILQDIFRFVSIDLTTFKGHINILKNGQAASFSEQLSDGDSITIDW